MKMIKKLLCTLVLTTTMFSAVGCGSLFTTGNGGSSDENVKPYPYSLSGVNVIDNGCYMLLDFETYWETVQPIWAATFGKVTMITDSAYVTHGKQSVKMEITGTEQSMGYVRPHINLDTTNQYFQKTDFTDCDYFAFDIYNALDYDNHVDFQVGSKIVKTVECKPGWNYVKVDVSDEVFSNVDLSNVLQFRFWFDRGEDHEVTQVFYMDNFRAHKKS